jgi:hypothetical protein
MSGYRNCIVRAEFRNGVAIDSAFTLDGLLGALVIRSPEQRQRMRFRRNYVRMCRRYGEERAKEIFAERGWEIPRSVHMLPLAVWGHGLKSGLWVYASSYAFPDDPWEYDMVYWARRENTEQIVRWVDEGNLPKHLHLGKGPYRSYYMPLPVIVAPALTWYVRGDPEEIERLLREAPYIGKKRSQGHGRVSRWIVEEDERDRSVWDGDRLMRPIPAELLELMGIEGEFEYGYYAYRPPYHDPRNFTRCAMSGVRK